ncbi:hypothetical protein EUGRSUZ_F04174 [Eucalyptus grandis]|uniref:Uncharacterized protein n=2 Tax=Eucalyptus grandis TaxID=71139 RepID=A0ACC3KNX1_EUCGR|nr:hypothetical protein EUGRSUZ_F04174 [Eucalyptus grandis]
MQPTSQVHGNTANSTPHLSRFSRHVPPQGMESDGFRGIWVPQFHQARLRKFKSEEMEARMEGKNCIVTGANSGLGYATAEGLASRGANVYMICRDKERGEAALSSIKSTMGNPNVNLEVCDLSSINEIKSFASRFSSKDLPLHVLVNSAGLLEHKRITMPEGAGTFAMAELMLPLLEKVAPDAQVITVSSAGMYTSPLTTDLEGIALSEHLSGFI